MASGIADDMTACSYEADGSNHNRCAEQILQQCDLKNLKLNPGECIMRCTCMLFYGFVVSKLDLQLDPCNVDAIKHIQVPQDVKSPIIPRNEKLPDALYFQGVWFSQAFKRSFERYQWKWLKYKTAFERIKDTISKDTALKYYDVKQDLYFEVEAS